MVFKNYYRLMLDLIGKTIFTAATVAAFMAMCILFS